jgi:hypothetical protein
MERETLNERETQKNVRFPPGDPSFSLSMGYLQYSEGSFFFQIWGFYYGTSAGAGSPKAIRKTL